MSRTYTLIGADGEPHECATPGTLGGHRGARIYGRLDCPTALRAIARGGYVCHRVFFADEATALAAGYRPCGTCLPEKHRAWKQRAAPCSEVELRTVLRLLRGLRPTPVAVVIGSSRDALSLTNAARVAKTWTDNGGLVLATVSWPETAASWLRHARQFTAPQPDAWIVTGTPAGWIGMGRRLTQSTNWSARRTVATAGLADPALVTTDTFDGLCGAHVDGRSWHVVRTLLVHNDRPDGEI
jgi:hypothetical protein